MNRLAQAAFFAAALLTLVMASLPHPPHVPGSPPDKLQHMLAFATLAALGLVAFPRVRPMLLLLGLVGFGALIEAIQAIPALNRDSDIMDLMADAAAVIIVGGIVRWILASRGR